jgi:hypothetical protein
MSAFMVSADTWGRIYSGFTVYCRQDHGYYLNLNWPYRKLVEACAPWRVDELHSETRSVIRALYSLNVDAVNQRYNDSNQETMPREVLRTATTLNPHITLVQFIKSINCVQYQMSEGNIPELPVYKALTRLINSAERTPLIMSLEYERAKWN